MLFLVKEKEEEEEKGKERLKKEGKECKESERGSMSKERQDYIN